MIVIIVKDKKVQTFQNCALKDGGIWVKTSKGLMPFLDGSLLEAKGLDPQIISKEGAGPQHPDCFLKFGLNPGGATVYTAEEYQVVKDAKRQQEERERIAQRAQIIEEHIAANTVILQRHAYADVKWSLCYGDINERIYPTGEIDLDRGPDETYMSGIRWVLSAQEYQHLLDIPRQKAEIQYGLTECTGMPPGVDEIRREKNALDQASAKYSRAHEREEFAPYPSNKSYLAALAKYPRAALYLCCESYTAAANYHKAEAGKQAMDLLERGGKSEDIQSILDNWVPPEAMWD